MLTMELLVHPNVFTVGKKSAMVLILITNAETMMFRILVLNGARSQLIALEENTVCPDNVYSLLKQQRA